MGVLIYAESKFISKKKTIANKMDSAALEAMFKKIEEIKKKEQKNS